MAASMMRVLMAGSVLCAAVPAQALESLPDPTLPAREIYAPGARSSAHAAAAMPEELKSIVISPRRRAALINGVTVELGGKIGDATLVEVHDSSVVLLGPQGKRVLELFPGVRLSKDAALRKEQPIPLKQQEASGNKPNDAQGAEVGSAAQNKDGK